MKPQKPQPVQEEAEVVSDGGEDGVVGVAGPVGEVASSHSVFSFEMTDDGFDGGAASEVSFDRWCDASLLP